MNETVESPAKAYFKKIFAKKQLITKGIILVAAIIIVIVPALCFYFTWGGMDSGLIYSGKLINITIMWNDGIATSALAGNYAAIYAIQSIVFVILTGLFLFLANDKLTASFIALAMCGGLFNLLQRACQTGIHANCVFDYIQFVPWLQWMSLGNTVFNWPDMGVVIGIIGFLISFIVLTIIRCVRESKKRKELNEQFAKLEEENNKLSSKENK